MNTQQWLTVPVGIDSSRWVTRRGCRVVLVVVHTMVSCHRLLDVVESLEDDSRVQVVFTVAPDAFNNGVERRLDNLGALVLPWQQAIKERFDLALATSYGGLRDIHSPVVVMAHGAGHGKTIRNGYSPRSSRDERLLPAALLLSHEYERDVLRRQCPDALAVATVAGDPCYDRLVRSLAHRDLYRRALDVAADQELLVVSSTWGPSGLFGRFPDLLAQLAEESADGPMRVAALLHPAVWSAHGHRQVRGWLRASRDAGLILLEPEDEWRGVVIAADYVIGDHGSVTGYAGAIGRPVLHPFTWSGPPVSYGSPQSVVMKAAQRIELNRPLLPQLRQARPADPAQVVAALTSRPGEADGLIRGQVYRMLALDEPTPHASPGPVPIAASLRPTSVARLECSVS
jgi:hypothetical protein